MADDALMSMLDVQPAALFTFSENLTAKAAAASEQINAKLSDLGSARVGFAPVPSSGSLARGYVSTVEQTAGIMEDVAKGSAAFMVAAQTIAANYVISDDAGKDEMTDVQSAFDILNVPEGQQTYSEMYAADAQTAEERVGAIEPVQLPEATDPTPNDCTAPDDSAAEQAAREAAEFQDFDRDVNNSNGLEDVYVSIDAPVDVQVAANDATVNDATLQVVNEDGSLTRIPNPIYVPPEYPGGYGHYGT